MKRESGRYWRNKSMENLIHYHSKGNHQLYLKIHFWNPEIKVLVQFQRLQIVFLSLFLILGILFISL